MHQFEIHWRFLIEADPAECHEMVSRIRHCLPDLIGFQATVTDHKQSLNWIELTLVRWFTVQEEASEFGQRMLDKVKAGLVGKRDAYYYVIFLANKAQPH